MFHKPKFLVKFISYGEICHKSFCILSAEMFHDVNMIHEIQRLVIAKLAAELAHISSLKLNMSLIVVVLLSTKIVTVIP